MYKFFIALGMVISSLSVNATAANCFKTSKDLVDDLYKKYPLMDEKKDIADGSIGDQSCHCYYFYAAAFLSAREYYELFHGNFCIYLFYHGGRIYSCCDCY